jgi:L-lactate dehydrogenase complex protein LldE
MRVSLFVTCVVDILRPRVAEAAVRVLRRRGDKVGVPLDQTCCGQPAWNSGYRDEARAVARNTLRAFAGADRVVCLAGSCATMVRVFYRELFEGRPELADAEALAERTSELSEFLAARPSAAGSALESGRVIAYHDSCHMLRELRIKAQPRSLLEAAGYDIVGLPGAERCCGFGGTFSVKLPAVSTAMADEKLAEVEASGASKLVGCDSSCLLHLEGRSRRLGKGLSFMHLAEALDASEPS